MKIKDLIITLEDFDPNLEVMIFDGNLGEKIRISEVDYDWDNDGNAIADGPVLIHSES